MSKYSYIDHMPPDATLEDIQNFHHQIRLSDRETEELI